MATNTWRSDRVSRLIGGEVAEGCDVKFSVVVDGASTAANLDLPVADGRC
jgi:hypothetical protein